MILSKKITSGLVFSIWIIFHCSMSLAFVTETVTTDNTSSVSAPSVVTDGTYAYAVWQERAADGYTHIYYKRKSLTGAWSDSTKEMVSSEQLSANARNPKIAVNGTHVFVT
ncbi:MAG: hypothetical protein PHR23_01685, partial [bacterium]|nr:hypothetical protein [bacterium]